MTLTNRLLGYPDDARLLIINADDLGMCHAVNAAIFRTLKEGVVRSTTLMVPCPWALHAMQWLHENPALTFGVHLTLVCEPASYRWGSVAPKDQVPSLLDESGYFFSYDRIPELMGQAKIDEVELEFRAQIETVLNAQLKPTHLDWHCLRSGGRADIFEMTLELARDYGLAVRVADRDRHEKVQSWGLPTADFDLMDSYRLATVEKFERYTQMLRDLPVGLTEWAVHPAFENAEYQAVFPASPPVRQTDFDFLMSPQAHATILEEGIILLNYKPLQTIWEAQV